jgi:hypothetical protein
MSPLPTDFGIGLLAKSLSRCWTGAAAVAFCAVRVEVGVVFARWWGVGGVGLAIEPSKVFTSSPKQLYRIRGILSANRAPALVRQECAVV